MNVGYISSDKMAPYLGTSLMSLLDHNRYVKELKVFVFSVDITEENKANIVSIANDFGRNVEFVEKNEEMSKIVENNNLTCFGGISSTYVKIFPNLFFGGIDKILMLDSDTIINASLEELYDTELGECFVGAVPEITGYYFSSEDPQVLHKNQFYYNTGVLLWNLRKMRETHFEERILEAFHNYGKPLKLADQSLINITVDSSEVKPLNVKYNFNNNLNFIFAGIRREVMEQYEYRGLGIIEADYYKSIKAKHIAIIHYLGAYRPWIKWRLPPHRGLFLKYWKKSPWKKQKFESYLDQMIQTKLSIDPNAFVGKKFVGRIYAAIIAILERYFPETFKELKAIKTKRRK